MQIDPKISGRDRLRFTLNRAAWNTNKKTQVVDIDRSATLKKVLEIHQSGNFTAALQLIADYINSDHSLGIYPKTSMIEGLCHMGLKEYSKALRSFELASTRYAGRLDAFTRENEDSSNELADQIRIAAFGQSAAASNCSSCYLAIQDYDQAEESALMAMDFNNRWHGPYVNLFSAYLRRDNVDALDEAILTMFARWPQWQNDCDLSRHLYGTDDEIADTDLTGLLERPVFQSMNKIFNRG